MPEAAGSLLLLRLGLLLLAISASLLLACFIESMNWTSRLAVLAAPVVRFARLSESSGAAFALSFFSSLAANAMLAEAYEKQKISSRELLLANVFNSLPAYFIHLPTTFFLAFSLIGSAAFLYVSLTAGAAFLRTAAVSLISRQLLPEQPAPVSSGQRQEEPTGWRVAWQRAAARFRKRIRNIILCTAPIYLLFHALAAAGFFRLLEEFIAAQAAFPSWLSPKAASIIVLQIMAEFTAGLAAASALLQDGSMDARQVILALLIGNILSSPVRAMRRQFPAYAGLFRPRPALLLILSSQGGRAASLMLTAFLYFIATR